MDQITYQAPQGSAGAITMVAASLSGQAEARTWFQRLEPFLRAGRPLGSGYLDFGARAAFIRWYADARVPVDWQYAHAFVGERGVLTASYALELPGLDPATLPDKRLVPVAETSRGAGHDAIAALARSADARPVLIPLLACVLLGERRITMPWTAPWLPEAALWGMVSILRVIGDAQPVSFLTYASASYVNGALPGTFVSFRPGAALVPPDPGFVRLATVLAERFAESADELRQAVAEHGVDTAPDRATRIDGLLTLLRRTRPEASAGWRATARGAPAAGAASSPRGTARNTKTTGDNAEITEGATAISGNSANTTDNMRHAPGHVVVCPICLGEIKDWNTQDYWQWDPGTGKYAKLEVPEGFTQMQLARHLRGAHIRCTARQEGTGRESQAAHFLPVNYGRFGRPVLLGFVGETMSGKSHLLSSMVARIVAQELTGSYGIRYSPLDYARHQAFMDDFVTPLLRRGQVLPGTREDVVEFADAFLMKGEDGQPRPVAFFDVAGGDLTQLKATNFLWIVDGLFFVVDPSRLDGNWKEDKTFSNVLDVIRESGRSDEVSAAIVLTKADRLRFDEPVARWLRSESGPLDATDLLRESADVYAYLEARNALALAEPYQVCAKATLHVASATGGRGEEEGGVYPRGVRPRRVVRPLAAMLAMTGVLTGGEAGRVGI